MKLVNRLFRANYLTDDCWIDGEFFPDLAKDRDFKVLSKAVVFAKANAKEFGCVHIEQVDIYDDHGIGREKVSKKWEIDGSGESCLIWPN